MKRSLPKYLKVLFAAALGAVVGLPAAPGASISGTFASIPSGSVVELTQEGQIDWVHWGLYTETSLNRKAGVVSQISDFVPVSNSNGVAVVYQFADNFNGYSWQDGSPVAAVTNTTTGVWAFGTPVQGSGFRIFAPADTGTRTLQVYVGAFKARGKLEAFVGDGSARGYTNSSLFNTGNGPSGVYTLVYSADAPGQTLTVRWTLAMPSGPDANVTLQAAAMVSSTANNPPFTSFLSPANNATFSAGGDIVLRAMASDLDGTVSNVEFFHDDTKIGEDGTDPYEVTWSNVPPGMYRLSLRTTDNEGAVSTAGPVEIFVHGQGGSLVGSRVIPPALPVAVNLTAEGARDWIHWGLASNRPMDRKAGVAAQLSNFTKIGTNAVNRYANNYTAFSWTDGAPTTSATATPTGVFTYGLEEGFELSAQADTTARTLRIYAGLFGAQGNFQAWLSDFSAPAYTDTTLSSLGNGHAVYQLDYRAASANQRLIVRYRSLALFDSDFGNVTLQAATLAGGDETPPLVLFAPSSTSSDFRFSFVTEAGHSYTVQSSDALFAATWQTLTNVNGTGANAVVNDSSAHASRFYRVRSP